MVRQMWRKALVSVFLFLCFDHELSWMESGSAPVNPMEFAAILAAVCLLLIFVVSLLTERPALSSVAGLTWPRRKEAVLMSEVREERRWFEYFWARRRNMNGVFFFLFLVDDRTGTERTRKQRQGRGRE